MQPATSPLIPYHSTPVAEFHRVFDHPLKYDPTVPDEGQRKLRCNMIAEELGELLKASGLYMNMIYDPSAEGANSEGYVISVQVLDGVEPDVIEAADALGDLRYVVDGGNLIWGIPGDAVFAEIHASNMSKLGPDGKPLRRPDGKTLKGPNYFKPDIGRAIRRGWMRAHSGLPPHEVAELRRLESAQHEWDAIDVLVRYGAAKQVLSNYPAPDAYKVIDASGVLPLCTVYTKEDMLHWANKGYPIVPMWKSVDQRLLHFACLDCGHHDDKSDSFTAVRYMDDADVMCSRCHSLSTSEIGEAYTELFRKLRKAQDIDVRYVIANGAGDRYRTWESGMPGWTTDVNKAICLSRRIDAEHLAQEDEDAWRIEEHAWHGAVLTSKRMSSTKTMYLVPDNESKRPNAYLLYDVYQVGMPNKVVFDGAPQSLAAEMLLELLSDAHKALDVDSKSPSALLKRLDEAIRFINWACKYKPHDFGARG